MARSDWTVYRTNAATASQLVVDTFNPVAPSLSFYSFSGVIERHNAHLTNPLLRGFTKGKIQGLLTVRLWSVDLQFFQTGFVSQQSQLDLSGTTGVAYYMAVGTVGTPDNTLSSFSVKLYRLVNGLQETGRVQLATGGNFLENTGLQTAYEFQWDYNVAVYGGIRLITRRGVAGSTNFATLSVVSDIISTSTVLATTVGEGLALSKENATSPHQQIQWDTMTLFQDAGA
jgi:hypothetical protein